MAYKQGDLRVLKGEAIYGPMARSDLERLLSEGRIDSNDQVSVRDGPWVAIRDYQANPQQYESSGDSSAPAELPESARQRELRVLKGDRVFSSFTRGQVAELVEAGRFSGDDLICVLDGPWMKLGDFFAPPPEAAMPVALDDDLETGPVIPGNVFEIAELVDPYGGFRGTAPARPALSDEWYVKVRGIHSAPIQKRHLRSLLSAGEITPDCPVRHPTWRGDTWQSVRAVAELADLVR